MKKQKRSQFNSDPIFDIKSWTSGIEKLRERLKPESNPGLKGTAVIRLDQLEPRLVYALLAEFISPTPNGIYTLLARGYPADNIVWWDFVLGVGAHLFTVHSGVNGLVVDAYSLPAGFDVALFFEQNIRKYRARVDARALTYERHEVYVNHFHSYRRCVDWLSTQVEAMKTEPPSFRGGIFETQADAERAMKEISAFTNNSIHYHVLSNALLVNSAFMCEALVSTLLRIGALPPLLREPKSLRPLLRASFMQRVEVLHAYTRLFVRPIEISAEPVSRANDLMKKRNKFVHSEFSDETRLRDAFFDGDVPLYGGGSLGHIAESTMRTYHALPKAEVLREAEVARQFCHYVLRGLRGEVREQIEFMLDQPQLGYNTVKRIYSVPFPSDLVQTSMVLSSDGSAARTDS